MALTLMYITNNPRVAEIAQEAGVNRVWVDMEYIGKKLADRELQTCAASAGWGREAIGACLLAVSKRETAKIRIPILLFQAGDDVFVKNESQDLFASRVPGCRVQKMPGLRHELFFSDTETLKKYWE